MCPQCLAICSFFCLLLKESRGKREFMLTPSHIGVNVWIRLLTNHARPPYMASLSVPIVSSGATYEIDQTDIIHFFLFSQKTYLCVITRLLSTQMKNITTCSDFVFTFEFCLIIGRLPQTSGSLGTNLRNPPLSIAQHRKEVVTAKTDSFQRLFFFILI